MDSPSASSAADETDDFEAPNDLIDASGQTPFENLLSALPDDPKDMPPGELGPKALIRKTLEVPYKSWLMLTDYKDRDKVLRCILENQGFCEAATGRITIPEDRRNTGTDHMAQLRQWQEGIADMFNRLHGSSLCLNPQTRDTMNIIFEHAGRLSRVLDDARIGFQAVTSVLGELTDWHPLDNIGEDEALYYRNVCNQRPLMTKDLNKDIMARLVLTLLREFKTRGYRKKRHCEYLFQETIIQTPMGLQTTYCFAPLEHTLKDLVYSIITKDTYVDLWAYILHGRNVQNAIDYILHGKDLELPELRAQPDMWSFDDGVYCGRTDRFALYPDVPRVFPELVGHVGRSTYKYLRGYRMKEVYFVEAQGAALINYPTSPGPTPYGPLHCQSPDIPCEVLLPISRMGISPRASPPMSATPITKRVLQEDEEERREFEAVFKRQRRHGPSRSSLNTPRTNANPEDLEEDREDIEEEPEAPAGTRKRTLDELLAQMHNYLKLFRDQGWSEETILLKLATLGRTFWPAKKYDRCQFWPLDIGVSGCGKSTVIDIHKTFFHFHDIGIFSADQEKEFSRDKLPQKRIIIAPEVRDNFGCSNAFFLAIVSGDPVSIPKKYGDPIELEQWTVQGLMATNELPPSFKDRKGSLLRRILPFPYTKEIAVKDPNLYQIIMEKELPFLLRAMCVAYMEYFPKDVDIMSGYELPVEIQNEMAKMQRQHHPLVDFLLSEDLVVRGDDCSVPLQELRQDFMSFVKNIRNDSPPAWSEDLYEGPFRLLHLRVAVQDGDTVVLGCALRRQLE